MKKAEAWGMIRDIIINYQVALKSPYWCKGSNIKI